MKTDSNEWQTAKLAGNNGVQLITGTDATTPTARVSQKNRWYSFVINAEAVISAVTLVKSDGTVISGYTPSWIGETLAAGMYIPLGVYDGDWVYATSITLTSGSILAYFD